MQTTGQPRLEAACAQHWDARLDAARRLIRDRAAAEDIVQDVFLDLWRMPDRYESDRASLRTYLLVKTRGRAIDVLRSDTARREREARELGRRIEPDATGR